MTQTLEQPASEAGQAEETEQEAGRGGLGRALDVAGIVAGVVLGVILFDLLSGGKVTRWAQRKRGPGPDAGPAPCEGCGDDA